MDCIFSCSKLIFRLVRKAKTINGDFFSIIIRVWSLKRVIFIKKGKNIILYFKKILKWKHVRIHFFFCAVVSLSKITVICFNSTQKISFKLLSAKKKGRTELCNCSSFGIKTEEGTDLFSFWQSSGECFFIERRYIKKENTRLLRIFAA